MLVGPDNSSPLTFPVVGAPPTVSRILHEAKQPLQLPVVHCIPSQTTPVQVTQFNNNKNNTVPEKHQNNCAWNNKYVLRITFLFFSFLSFFFMLTEPENRSAGETQNTVQTVPVLKEGVTGFST